jgi:taurine---2-oxoglutarate transaminase
MLSEARTVLHTWCRQTQWNAPTIVGGAGARLLTADGSSILDMSPERELADALDPLERLLRSLAESAALSTGKPL